MAGRRMTKAGTGSPALFASAMNAYGCALVYNNEAIQLPLSLDT
jgi:hypothetical protein